MIAMIIFLFIYFTTLNLTKIYDKSHKNGFGAFIKGAAELLESYVNLTKIIHKNKNLILNDCISKYTTVNKNVHFLRLNQKISIFSSQKRVQS